MSIAELPASQPVDVRAVIGAGAAANAPEIIDAAPQLEGLAA
ncbi:hypothetical protein [Allopontixanthobacter confluentis]|nr:hypothetical protein [Allopontixanthobacter confluentis]